MGRASGGASRIAVLGCTGFTGRLVTMLLDELGERLILVGRNASSLQDLASRCKGEQEARPADATTAAGVEAALEGASAVISCIGPYNLYGSAIRDAAIRRGMLYVDVTGEQPFVRESFATRFDAADAAGATIVHSCAFESCLADLVGRQVTTPGRKYEDISSYYQFSDARPSPGTRFSMKLARFFDQFAYEEGRFLLRRPLEVRRKVCFSDPKLLSCAAFMPYPEVLFFSRTHDTRNALSFVLLEEGELELADRLTNSEGLPTFHQTVERSMFRTTKGLSEDERKNQRFTLVVEARADDGRVQRGILEGQDMYGLTADLAVWATLDLLRNESRPTGVLTPGEALSSEFLEKAVARTGMELCVQSG